LSVPIERPAVETPCIKVCRIDAQARLCTGCFRSLDEIAAWSRMSGAQRRSIMAELATRAPRVVAGPDAPATSEGSSAS